MASATIEVFGLEGSYLGDAISFGAARLMQTASLPHELRPAYAGIGTEGQPLFYIDELSAELAEKHRKAVGNGIFT